MCSNSELLKTELKHTEEVLSHCKYPKWAIEYYIYNRKAKKTEIEGRKVTTTPAIEIEDVTGWYLTHKDYVETPRTSVANMVSRYISKGRTH